MECATKWLSEKFWYLNTPTSIEYYSKGEFQGIVFANFATTTERDAAMTALRSARCQKFGKAVWAKEDKPLEEWIVDSIVFGIKRVMCEDWGYEGKSIWADPGTGAVWIGEEEAIIISIEGGCLKTKYGPGREVYFTNESWPEARTVISEAQAKLSKKATKGTGKKGKGIGKGTGKDKQGKAKGY